MAKLFNCYIVAIALLLRYGKEIPMFDCSIVELLKYTIVKWLNCSIVNNVTI